MIKAVIFDFDGVIAESMDVKTEAFRELFKEYPENIDEIERFHLDNGGMSRYDKFRYIYGNILKEGLSEERFNELCLAFHNLVVDKVVEVPFVKGAKDVLDYCLGKYPMYIVSGTPEDEMREIVRRKALEKYFISVYGSPDSKAKLINGILKKDGYRPDEVLFIGDSKNDLDATVETGIPFIARINAGNQEWAESPNTKAVCEDLTGLYDLFESEKWHEKKEIVTEETKKAWSDNWKNLRVEGLLEIFSYPRVQRLLKFLISVLPKEGKILEGGCGLGPWVIKLRSLGYDMVGVDYDSVSIEKIRSYDSNIPLYVSNVEKMPFEDNYFEAYISLGVLEHFCDGPQTAIKEANRVLKKNGLFLVMLPYMNIFRRLKYPMEMIKRNSPLRRLLKKEERNYYYEQYFKIKEIEDLLVEGGFIIDNVRPIDHIFSYVSFSGIFRKKDTIDGENELAVKFADFFEKIFPWQTAGSSFIVAKKK